ncbi:hypothetical protein [Nitrosospira multiformis]|uniref:hypothetical protein n=1 Tax=Nitrosospira multiformis TaxID=1231 RepID=UPI0015A58C91|nr:hypothetical protein [Nitrosospira multiformis]
MSRAKARVEAMGRELGEAWEEIKLKKSRDRENRGEEREALSRAGHQIRFPPTL